MDLEGRIERDQKGFIEEQKREAGKTRIKKTRRDEERVIRMAGRLLLILASILVGMPCVAQSKLVTLRPSKDYWDYARPASVHVARLSPNRKLAIVGDTLYMLDKRNRIVWQWTSGGAPFTDSPIVDSKGTIYVIGYDLLWAAIDSTTGKEKWQATANGRATYSQIKLYRGDMYLVVTDMSGYRDSLQDKGIEDELWLCRGNAVLWETYIPANSRITVSGRKVLVSYKHKKHHVRRLIGTPQHFGRPITRISVFADFDGRPIIDAK